MHEKKAFWNIMMSEITEQNDEEQTLVFIKKEAEKEKIRQIIEYQKSLYRSASSSSSLSSSSASCSSFSSLHKSSNLLDLMKGGSTSLRRLFDMEHTSLANHFEDYSGSPVIKTIPLWGSDTDDPWASIKQIGTFSVHGTDEPTMFVTEASFKDEAFGFKNKKARISRRKLSRKKSFRRLPGFCLWRCRRYGFRLRFKRLRIMICGKLF